MQQLSRLLATEPSWLSTRPAILDEDLNLWVKDSEAGCGILMANLAARVTQGWPMPPAPVNPCEPGTRLEAPGSVIIVSPEDRTTDTTLPRMIANGANLDYVFDLSRPERGKHVGGHVRPKFSLPGDFGLLEKKINEIPEIELEDGSHPPAVRMIILDNLDAIATETTAVGRKVRMLYLDPLQDLGERTGVSIQLVMHFTKGSASQSWWATNNTAIKDRVGGSKSLTSGPRVVNWIGKDDLDPEIRMITSLKNNPGTHYEPVRFKIKGEPPYSYIVFEQPPPEIEGLDKLEQFVLQHYIDVGRAVSTQEMVQLTQVRHDIIKQVTIKLHRSGHLEKLGRSYVAVEAIEDADTGPIPALPSGEEE